MDRILLFELEKRGLSGNDGVILVRGHILIYELCIIIIRLTPCTAHSLASCDVFTIDPERVWGTIRVGQRCGVIVFSWKKVAIIILHFCTTMMTSLTAAMAATLVLFFLSMETHAFLLLLQVGRPTRSQSNLAMSALAPPREMSPDAFDDDDKSQQIHHIQDEHQYRWVDVCSLTSHLVIYKC